MMKIETMRSGAQLTLSLAGRLDVRTAKLLEAELKHSLAGTQRLVIDIAHLAYLASAGLRVLTAAQRIMNRQGEMVILHANETVR